MRNWATREGLLNNSASVSNRLRSKYNEMFEWMSMVIWEKVVVWVLTSKKKQLLYQILPNSSKDFWLVSNYVHCQHLPALTASLPLLTHPIYNRLEKYVLIIYKWYMTNGEIWEAICPINLSSDMVRTQSGWMRWRDKKGWLSWKRWLRVRNPRVICLKTKATVMQNSCAYQFLSYQLSKSRWASEYDLAHWKRCFLKILPLTYCVDLQGGIEQEL